ncbi:hypothetical protein [Zavarzinella formosa]|uniref:hypothetical protein n=1 Tax=Zavarzinella formosa TaxID=360055 RepID=UPI0012FB7B0E|nr:hypothetical protein [Zavarzinella formosa]
MENLIRAHDKLPFVQVAYADITVQDNDQLGATLGGSQSLTEQLFDPIQRTYATMFSPGGSATRSRTMSFVANPVTDQNDVYEAYIKFACDPTLFMVSDDDPGCAAHIVRKQCKKYYWVPKEASQEFFNLAMTTTFLRGPEAAPPGAYEGTILSVTSVVKTNLKDGMPIIPTLPGDLTTAQLNLSMPVPSGDATMVAKLTDGRTIRVFLKRIPTRIDEDGKKVNVPDGEPTTAFSTRPWSPAATGYTELDLVGAKVRLYSNDFPPDAPVPAPKTLHRIKADLNYLRNLPNPIRR